MRAEELGGIAFGRTIGTHTPLRICARYLLMNGIRISYVNRWLGYSSIQTKLTHLELFPNLSGSLFRVP